MRTLDAFILSLIDSAVIKLQRRGWLLTNIYVGFSAAVLLFGLSSALTPSLSPDMLGLVIVFWGTWLFFSVRWAERNKDYPQSVKLTKQLNARAVYERENSSAVFLRLFWLFLLNIGLLVLLLEGLVPKQVFVTLLDVSATVMVYLQACTFLGPGDFASKRNKEFARDTVPYET